jgi:hypothetical protein
MVTLLAAGTPLAFLTQYRKEDLLDFHHGLLPGFLSWQISHGV